MSKAFTGVALAIPGDEPTGDGIRTIQALRLGPVVSRKTGETIIEIDDARCERLASAFNALDRRMPTPIDLDHGLVLGKDAESRRTYGQVVGLKAEPGVGLFADIRPNTGGAKWLADNEGGAYVSPSILPNLYDPETPDTLLATEWLHSLSFTVQPRQSGLPEISSAFLSEAADTAAGIELAEFASSAEVRAFDRALEYGASEVLRAEGFADATYVSERVWHDDGNGSGRVVISWWGDGDGRSLRQLTWARDGSRVVVSGPSVPVEEFTDYRLVDVESSPVAAASSEQTMQTRTDLAEPTVQAAHAKQSNTPGRAARQTQAVEDTMPENKAPVLLSEIPDEDLRKRAGEMLSEATSRAETAEAEVESLRTQLSEATRRADGAEQVQKSLGARVDELETAERDRRSAEAKVAADKFVATLLAEQRIPSKDTDTGLKGPEFWREQFTANPDAARTLAEQLPANRFGPPNGGAPTGVGGHGEDDGGDAEVKRHAAIDTAAKALLSEGKATNYDAAWVAAERSLNTSKGGV